MSAELQELYQSIILDHNRRPKNFRAMDDATSRAEGLNPMCGDQLTVWLRLENDSVADVSFQGQGCAISKASASLMTQAVKGKPRADAEKLFDEFHAMVTGKGDGAELGSLKALSGVSKFPLRVKCASLAWHAMKSALADGYERVSAADLAAGELRAVTMTDGTKVCLANSEGELLAVQNECTHSAFPLSEGSLHRGGVLECGWHGATFDCRTGKALQAPAFESLTRYDVRVRGDGIWIKRKTEAT